MSTRTALFRCMVLQHQRLASRQPEPELAIHRCSCRRWSHREKVNLLHRLPAQGKVTSIIEEPLTNRCLTDTLLLTLARAGTSHTAAGSSIKAQSPIRFQCFPHHPCFLLGATTLCPKVVHCDLVPRAGMGDRADTTPSVIAPVGTSNRGSTDVLWRLLAAVIDPWRAAVDLFSTGLPGGQGKGGEEGSRRG